MNFDDARILQVIQAPDGLYAVYDSGRLPVLCLALCEVGADQFIRGVVMRPDKERLPGMENVLVFADDVPHFWSLETK